MGQHFQGKKQSFKASFAANKTSPLKFLANIHAAAA
jgi:hypothetical protein